METITPDTIDAAAAIGGWFPDPMILGLLFLGVIALCLTSVGNERNDV